MNSREKILGEEEKSNDREEERERECVCVSVSRRLSGATTIVSPFLSHTSVSLVHFLTDGRKFCKHLLPAFSPFARLMP